MRVWLSSFSSPQGICQTDKSNENIWSYYARSQYSLEASYCLHYLDCAYSASGLFMCLSPLLCTNYIGPSPIHDFALCWFFCPSSHYLFIKPLSLLVLSFSLRLTQYFWVAFRSDQIRSVAQSCLTLCDPMNRSTPGFPVHHQLPEFTQTHVHRVSDAIQPSHPLSSPSPHAPNPSQHQSLFQWVNSSHEVAKVLEF